MFIGAVMGLVGVGLGAFGAHGLRGRLSPSKAKFLARAWKVAYQKGKTLGWIAPLTMA